MFNILTLGFDSAFSASKTATSIVLRQHKSPLISLEISGFSLFSELFEDIFSGVWWGDPNGDPYGSETPSVDRPCCIANVKIRCLCFAGE